MEGLASNGPVEKAARWGLAACALLLGACEAPAREPSEPPYRDREQEAHVEEEVAPPLEPPPAISNAPVRPAPDPRDRPPPRVEPALHGDGRWADGPAPIARRYVYRVRLAVPSWLGDGDDRVTIPAAELFVDVAHERLRARFGDGWPVDEGAEVRLRRDRPGVYLFDGEGGRPLSPGALARWFDGGAVGRRGPPLRIFGTYGFARNEPIRPDEEAPGELVCAFLAELGGDDRDAAMRRCERGAPRLWRLGFWRAEQTASVPVELGRDALRADERSRPPPIEPRDAGAFLEPAALARIEPEAPGEGGDGALEVVNDTENRILITAQGVALGWVDAGQEGRFVGLRPGTYELGAMRPLGAVVARARIVTVPGRNRICEGRCARLDALRDREATEAP